ncbi:MAG TPA: hypothetical protein VG387_04845 [Rhizomicrobium sp.]|nr:hypothetical protein [Rhizomicrobium sp.]
MSRWIAWPSAVVVVIAAVIAIAAYWKISLAIEARRCDAKSDAELLAMARHAAHDTAPQMGATGIDPAPVSSHYKPDGYARAKFVFRTLGEPPQAADVDISRNCHAAVGWLVTRPPLHWAAGA